MKCDESDIYLSNDIRQEKITGQQKEGNRTIEGKKWDDFIPFRRGLCCVMVRFRRVVEHKEMYFMGTV